MIDTLDVHNARLLVVDDQEPNVRLLVRLLRGAAYTSVESTMDPRAVCELYRKNRYDLILLDVGMPGMDGFEVMDGLREIEPDSYLPVLVLTAEPAHKLRALREGAKDFVAKPLNTAEVLMRVFNMLEVRLLYKEVHRLNEELRTQLAAARDRKPADARA